jgi:hypothetical protein
MKLENKEPIFKTLIKLKNYVHSAFNSIGSQCNNLKKGTLMASKKTKNRNNIVKTSKRSC